VIGAILVAIGLVLAILAGFGARVFDLTVLDQLTLAVVFVAVGVLVGYVVPWKR